MSMGMSGSAEKEVYVWINRVVLVLLFFYDTFQLLLPRSF